MIFTKDPYVVRHRGRVVSVYTLAVLVSLVIYSTPTAADGVASDEPSERSRPVVSQTSTQQDSALPEPLKLAIGDKLKVLFYERLGDAGDKWANLNRPAKPELSFYLHTELSGEFSIQPDRRISIPLLEDCIAANRSITEVAADLRLAFAKIVGHPGFVNIEVVERQPIYIIGPVKQPGVFKYQPGLTPLHIVALAGGFLRTELDRYAAIEAIRTSGKSAFSDSRLKRVLAKQAVLRAELDGVAVSMPRQLIELAGLRDADAMVAEEQAQRVSVVKARQQRQVALSVAIETARRVVQVARDRLAPLHASIDLRKNRFDSMQKLFTSGTIGNVMLVQVQSDLADAEDREAGVHGTIAESQQRLSLAELDDAKFKTDTSTEMEREIAAQQREIDELVPTLVADIGVTKLLGPTLDQNSTIENVKFEVLRHTENNTNVIVSDGSMQLQPGDLVRITSTNKNLNE